MSLRPRYSLLTLLILTAIVAGGVKLWYGPHHVVEWPVSPTIEFEYTFTRDWQGNRIIQGPRIRRAFSERDQSLYEIDVEYYQNGVNTNWKQSIYADTLKKVFQKAELVEDLFGKIIPLELRPEDQIEYQAAVEKEQSTLLNRGFRLVPFIQAP